MIKISDIKNRLEAKIHGSSINKINDFYGACQEAAGNLLLRVTLKELQRVSLLDTPVFDDVYRYTAPSDLHKDNISDIRPQVNRSLSDASNLTNIQTFDLRKDTNDFAVEYDSGTKFLRLSKQLTTGVTLHRMDSVTANGTWAVGGDAQNLVADDSFKVAGASSLKFDLSGTTGVGYIENSTMQQVDLSDEEDVGYMFVRPYLNDVSRFTSITVRWGNDSSNYWESTFTANFDGTAFNTGWNRGSGSWSATTETGTPDASVVDYARITFNYSAGDAIKDIRVDDLSFSVGSLYEIVYQSQNLFKNTSGTWIDIPTTDDDEVNIEVDSLPMFLYELALSVSQELQSDGGRFDISYFQNKGEQAYQLYSHANKSEVKKKRTSYYRI